MPFVEQTLNTQAKSFEESNYNRIELTSNMLSSESISKIAIHSPQILLNKFNNIIEIKKSNSKSQKEDFDKAIKVSSTEQDILSYDASLTEIVYIENNVPKKYSVLSTTTTSSDDKEENGVKLHGVICWIDNFGMNNQLVYCCGNRTGSYGSQQGHYQVNHLHGGTLLGGDFDTLFFETPDPNNNQGFGFRLTVQSRSTQASGYVTLSVTTSIFD